MKKLLIVLCSLLIVMLILLIGTRNFGSQQKNLKKAITVVFAYPNQLDSVTYPTKTSPQKTSIVSTPEPTPYRDNNSKPSTQLFRVEEQKDETTTILDLSPEQWKEWPVLPNHISPNLKRMYQQGIKDGNNPKAFSILGDCHSLPEVFLGIYDLNPAYVNTLSPSIQGTVSHFRGSFNRYSPTVRIGSTEGALLWPLWNDNLEGKCNDNESPLDCELRVHRPSIVFIHVGTHYESRNERYLTIIIEKLLKNGIVPIIVTKADNRELDERINLTLVKMATLYDLPVWNFWASVQHLDSKGIDEEDNMVLSEEGYKIHQQDGIKVLNQIWNQLN
ncbi:MAG: hypothetical protein Q7U53_07635 [Anaerolineaceae bacterium]|nr:hypothetical protein [Anaerolineaceae bacterium]